MRAPTPARRSRRALAALLAVAVTAAGACSTSTQEADPDAAPAAADDAPALDLASAGPADFTVSSSVEQLLVTGAGAGDALDVVDAEGRVVGSGTADGDGALLVRYLPPGEGYRAVHDGATGLVASEPAEVWAVDDVPDQSFYADQEIGAGYQYVEARDGTLLAVNVALPGPPEDGPYPTVVEYSGYDPANPDSLQPSKLLAQFFGYATVGVNMRGTGCSGGSFLFFEPAQSTDGYDVIEAVAAQPWVQDNEVAMVGLSYPGISQLFVAQTQPPSLAAIAPLSVIDDTYRSTLYPGGILNDGFATSWAEERQAEAEPGGQSWAAERIDDGDEVCEANQALRTQNPDLFEFIDDTQYAPADPSGYVGRLAPSEWVDRIEVPVFLAGAWQDEQTGGRFPVMLDRFTGAPLTRFTLTNGGHTEPFSPDILLRWTEFLDLYVAKRVPARPAAFETALSVLGGVVFGTGLELPDERFAGYDSYEEALADYEAEQPVRILFEHGAGAEPGHPVPGFEASFDAWPIPELAATTWYLAPGGALRASAPSGDDVESYEYDTSRAEQTSLPSADPWVALPGWDWEGPAEGTARAYATDPLDETLVMAGSGRVDLHFGSTAPDVDIQVTLSEVRPDGTEVYVQNGWLRASHRTLDEARSTELQPYHTHLEDDAEPLPDGGELVPLSVELFPFAHVFRAGSRIRLSVEGPGGTRPEWKFAAVEAPEGTTNHLGLGGATASRVTLPVIPGIDVPTPAPPCPSLRGQPCRAAPPGA